MTLYIDPTGGFAGDMFSAALISAGADKELMTEAMVLAASKIGKATVAVTKTHDDATRLLISIEHDHNHLSGHKAKHLLEDIFEELKLEETYRQFGMTALQNLIDAEIKAHKEHTFLTDHHHPHSHEAGDHHHSHDHSHNHGHHHHEKAEAYLHEAQDILIDITGAAFGLQLLRAGAEVILTNPVSTGGGMITFSHGTLPVPAPATENIINKFDIPAKEGPVDFELFTPTGAAILSALKPVLNSNIEIETENMRAGTSRGTKDLDIPPLKISTPLQ
jgi:uncharacterized protein (DUF111 family)